MNNRWFTLKVVSQDFRKIVLCCNLLKVKTYSGWQFSACERSLHHKVFDIPHTLSKSTFSKAENEKCIISQCTFLNRHVRFVRGKKYINLKRTPHPITHVTFWVDHQHGLWMHNIICVCLCVRNKSEEAPKAVMRCVNSSFSPLCLPIDDIKIDKYHVTPNGYNGISYHRFH